MSEQFHNFGTTLKAGEVFSVVQAQKTLTAVNKSRNYALIDCCKYECVQKGKADVLIVDSLNDQVPSRNPYGIKNKERLALAYYQNSKIDPETRALRKNFPTGIHQNSVNEGEAISLCLYDEPWTSTQRHWTAETHLKKILWWLERAASGNLHHEDQPIEPFFYPSNKKLVLPPDFDTRVVKNDRPELLLLGNGHDYLAFWESDVVNKHLFNDKKLKPVVLILSPIQHANIERTPLCLGNLQDILQRRGTDLLSPLKEAIKEAVPPEGVVEVKDDVLLIMGIPLLRDSDSTIERLQAVAFHIQSDICDLGVAIDVLNYDNVQKKFFKWQSLGQQLSSSATGWRNIEIKSANVVYANSLKATQSFSGISHQNSDFSGILAGVGSLGSALAEIWALEGWGCWTYVDYDRVEAHNIVRHTAKYSDIGLLKVQQVAQSTASNYYPSLVEPHPIPTSAANFENKEFSTALSTSDLMVDATTTLDVPRELAIHDNVPRSISAFFTPNGQDSVMLAEDQSRSIRLDSVEAQYYRAILDNDWGHNHLDKHRGDIWIGNGCRDISFVIPTDLVQLHSALLARKIRQVHDQEEAQIIVFSFNDEQGVAVLNIEPKVSTVFPMGDWDVIIDSEIIEKLAQMRLHELPEETGGVMLGFIDHTTHRIHVVNVLAAPFDSESSCSSFVRGTDGLEGILKEARRRTAGIVDYLGEWHSHPPSCEAIPSGLDMKLIDYLSSQLSNDGQPAIMLIVGESGISITLR